MAFWPGSFLVLMCDTSLFTTVLVLHISMYADLVKVGTFKEINWVMF